MPIKRKGKKIKLIIDGNLLARKSFYKFKNLSTKISNRNLSFFSKDLVKSDLGDKEEDLKEVISENSGRELSIKTIGKIERRIREISKNEDLVEINTGVLYGMLRSILLANTRFNIDKIIITYDPPYNISNQVRYKIDSSYKNRKKDPEIESLFNPSLSLSQSFFSKLGLIQVITKKFEADDLIHYYTHKVYKEDPCLVLTNDHDLFQILIPNRVKILKIGSDYSIYSASDFRSEFKISPKQYRQVLSLGGCSTDNVKGIPGISSSTALKLIQEFKSISNLFKSYKSSSLSSRIKSALEKEEDLSFYNLTLSTRLISLYGLHPSLEKDILIKKSSKPSESLYKSSIFLLNLLNFKSFLTESGINSLKSLIKSQEE